MSIRRALGERPRLRFVVRGALLVALSFGVVRGLARWTPLDHGAFTRPAESLTITDRSGAPLRHVRPRGEHRTWVELEDVSPQLITAILAAEDARFFDHDGVDLRATTRAALSWVVPGMPRSGGSTISQQTIKLTHGRPYGLFSKGLELLRAWALEARMSKREILEQYVNRVPFGDRIVGVERASEAYFGKPASALSWGEAAMLAGIPRAPSTTEPRRHFEAARARQRTVLARLRRLGHITAEEWERAEASPPVVRPADARAWFAPRFADGVTADHRAGVVPATARGAHRTIRTTLHRGLQADAERTLRASVARFHEHGVQNAAGVVLDHQTGEVLAYVGAAERGRDAPGGALDLARSRRQPGSTLKPFAYAMLFEAGATAATTLDDVARPMTDGDGARFVAEDYDGRQRGPVRAREALASSLNLAAIDAVTRVGTDRFVRRLRRLGFAAPRDPSSYGAAVVLGGVDITLVELATAYATLARGGVPVAMRRYPGPSVTGAAAIAPDSARIANDILRDGDARAHAFGDDLESLAGGEFALKTGTSSGFRDAWSAAYDERFVVAVWLGDPSGAAMREVSGFRAAAPAAARILGAARRSLDADPTRELSHAAGEGVGDPANGGERADQGGQDGENREHRENNAGRRADLTHASPGAAPLAVASICPLSGLAAGAYCPSRIDERFIPGTEPTHDCDMHGPGGARLSARHAAWARSAGWLVDEQDEPLRAEAPLRLTHPSASAAPNPARPRDTEQATTRWVLPRAQVVQLRANVAEGVTYEVDGVVVARGQWAATRGLHRVVARRGQERSEARLYIELLMVASR